VYTSTAEDEACHRGQGPAGIYGAESSDCDSPIELVNKTMDWIKKELKDKIDFIIWTGDSARHDNDEEYPRNEDQVVGLNEMMVQKFFEVFGKHNGDQEDEDPNNDYIIPIIPTFGNNDILPHNIFRMGPNKWTRIYAKVWRQFVPEAQRHQFEQGGWFYVEVIPNKLAVFSLNTLYFFTSNAAADGCALPSEPGYHQMEWLRIQLQFMRDRGMKAILTGHVPPTREESKTNWDETCWQKYTLWLRQYRDVVITSLYGHFNYDHFILQDFEDLRKGTKKGKMPDYSLEKEEEDEDDEVRTTGKSEYFVDLRNRWSEMPNPPKSLSWFEMMADKLSELRQSKLSFTRAKQMFAGVLKSEKKKRKKYFKKIGGEHAERYAASFVSASVVPNLYPTLRVFEYNITGLDIKFLEEGERSLSIAATPEFDQKILESQKTKTKKKKKGKKKYKFDVPKSPSKSSPPGPAYSPQTFSMVRFTQYLANLTHINNDFQALSSTDLDGEEYVNATGWKEGKHKGEKPHNKDHTPEPKKFKYEVHYDTRDDDVYQLKDLTMPSIVDLATRIGKFEPVDDDSIEDSDCASTDDDLDAEKKKNKKHKKKKKARQKQNEAWYTFVRRAFVETLSPEELHDEFGV
jgi:endopolyphosphatase